MVDEETHPPHNVERLEKRYINVINYYYYIPVAIVMLALANSSDECAMVISVRDGKYYILMNCTGHFCHAAEVMCTVWTTVTMLF